MPTTMRLGVEAEVDMDRMQFRKAVLANCVAGWGMPRSTGSATPTLTHYTAVAGWTCHAISTVIGDT